jgi:hypothetical protein
MYQLYPVASAGETAAAIGAYRHPRLRAIIRCGLRRKKIATAKPDDLRMALMLRDAAPLTRADPDFAVAARLLSMRAREASRGRKRLRASVLPPSS